MMIELKVEDYPAVKVFFSSKKQHIPALSVFCRGIIPGGYLPMMQLHQHLRWFGLRVDGCMLLEIAVQS